jgi:UDP-galactopyranose mutase
MKIERKPKMQLVCFSHLPWKFVYQRQQHLLSRFTKSYDVYYIEEFVYIDEEDGYSIQMTNEHVALITPHLNKRKQQYQNEKERKEKVKSNGNCKSI